MGKRVALFIVALTVLVGYVMACISPVKESIGRSHPGFAALLSPPWFNFDAIYTSGVVLDFRVGMKRGELGQRLIDRYANDSLLLRQCGDNSKFTIPILNVPLNSQNGGEALMSKDTLCIWNPSKRLMLIFFIQKESIAKIRVTLVNNEG